MHPTLPRRLLMAAMLAAAPLLAPSAGAQAPAAGTAAPAPLVVEKRVFEAGEYRTRGGGTIANLRIGYQTAGRLNEAGDNAVLVLHFFSANGHAFGRLNRADGPPGWWDAIIGPGKPIDTDRYFVVSADTPANINVPDPATVTTGPASINPDTGRPYGMAFPVVSMRDFVEVQKRLLDHLGVRRLALVTGPSNGGLNTIEWAAAYPGMIDRAMPVIAAEVDAWLVGWLDVWAAPIRLDPDWNNGDYYGPGRRRPDRGLLETLRIITIQARDREFFARFGRQPAEGQDPARRIGDRFAVSKWIEDALAPRLSGWDANSLLYMIRANQLFLNEHAGLDAALAQSRARWLVVSSPVDHIFLPATARDTVAALRRAGRPVELAEVPGPQGHYNGVTNIAAAADAIRAFLAR